MKNQHTIFYTKTHLAMMLAAFLLCCRTGRASCKGCSSCPLECGMLLYPINQLSFQLGQCAHPGIWTPTKLHLAWQQFPLDFFLEVPQKKTLPVSKPGLTPIDRRSRNRTKHKKHPVPKERLKGKDFSCDSTKHLLKTLIPNNLRRSTYKLTAGYVFKWFADSRLNYTK